MFALIQQDTENISMYGKIKQKYNQIKQISAITIQIWFRFRKYFSVGAQAH